MKKEAWKPICGFDGYYEVSSLGRIKSLSRTIIRRYRGHEKPLNIKERILKCSLSKTGYISVNLRKDNRSKILSVHRIVASAFLCRDKFKSQVNHIDGCKINNAVNNLEWCTPSENITHSYNSLYRKHPLGKKGKLNHNSRSVSQYTKDGVFINSFDTITEASELTNINGGNISLVCLNLRKSAGGFKWKYN